MGVNPARQRALSLLQEKRSHLADRIVSIIEVGSTMHGVTSDATDDDLDLMAVYIETPEEVMGNLPSDAMVRTQPNGVRSHAGDIDIQLYSLRKFAHLLKKGNPSLLQTLWAPPTHIHHGALDLTDMRGFVTAVQPAADAYLGYARQQYKRWNGEAGQRNVSRPELVEAHGYDTKYAYHAIRLGLQGIEFLQTGQITLPVPEDQRRKLLAVRQGEVSETAAKSWALMVLADLERAIEVSPLPLRPNQKGLDLWVAHAHLNSWYPE